MSTAAATSNGHSATICMILFPCLRVRGQGVWCWSSLLGMVHNFSSDHQDCGVQDSGFGTRDSEFGVRDSGIGIRYSGFGIRDSGIRIRDSGFGIRDSGFGVQNSGFETRDSGFRIQDSGFGIRVSEFGIRDSGFGIRVSDSGLVETSLRIDDAAARRSWYTATCSHPLFRQIRQSRHKEDRQGQSRPSTPIRQSKPNAVLGKSHFFRQKTPHDRVRHA